MVENQELNLLLSKHFIEVAINALIVIRKQYHDLLLVSINVENVVLSLLEKPIHFEVNHVLFVF